MDRTSPLARILFALGMIGLGVLGLTVGDFALQWQPVPAWLPFRQGVAYAAAVLMIVCGAGLLYAPAAAGSTRVLFRYLLLWMLLKVPGVFHAPMVAASWLGWGELAVLFSGGWVLFADLAGPRRALSLKLARILFGIALPAIGLSHFVYATQTAALVPAWLPMRTGWAYLTGVCHIAAGIAVLVGIYPRLAATLESAMLGVFTILVWGPAILAAPTARLAWTAFLISWAIAAAALVVAGSIPPGLRPRIAAV
jgi:uncharacterized membrane protein